jgi:hypothetical protein
MMLMGKNKFVDVLVWVFWERKFYNVYCWNFFKNVVAWNVIIYTWIFFSINPNCDICCILHWYCKKNTMSWWTANYLLHDNKFCIFVKKLSIFLIIVWCHGVIFLLMVISLNHIPYNVKLGVEMYILTKIQWFLLIKKCWKDLFIVPNIAY